MVKFIRFFVFVRIMWAILVVKLTRFILFFAIFCSFLTHHTENVCVCFVIFSIQFFFSKSFNLFLSFLKMKKDDKM